MSLCFIVIWSLCLFSHLLCSVRDRNISFALYLTETVICCHFHFFGNFRRKCFQERRLFRRFNTSGPFFVTKPRDDQKFNPKKNRARQVRNKNLCLLVILIVYFTCVVHRNIWDEFVVGFHSAQIVDTFKYIVIRGGPWSIQVSKAVRVSLLGLSNLLGMVTVLLAMFWINQSKRYVSKESDWKSES